MSHFLIVIPYKYPNLYDDSPPDDDFSPKTDDSPPFLHHSLYNVVTFCYSVHRFLYLVKLLFNGCVYFMNDKVFNSLFSHARTYNTEEISSRELVRDNYPYSVLNNLGKDHHFVEYNSSFLSSGKCINIIRIPHWTQPTGQHQTLDRAESYLQSTRSFKLFYIFINNNYFTQ